MHSNLTEIIQVIKFKNGNLCILHAQSETFQELFCVNFVSFGLEKVVADTNKR